MAQNFSVRPSELIGILDPVASLDFDFACLMAIGSERKTEDGADPLVRIMGADS